MRRLGYALMVPELIRARDHGVTPDYIEAMAAVGYKGLPIETLIRLRDHGVTPDYVEEARKRGFKDLPADEIIRLRDQGTGNRRTGTGEGARHHRHVPVRDQRRGLGVPGGSAEELMTSTAASATTRRTTAAAGAPSAMRTPISRVRRVTE